MYEIEVCDDHRLIHSIWRAHVEEPDEYLEPANEHWGLAFTRLPDGSITAELAGPTPRPRILVGIAGASHWGVELHPEVTIARLPKSQLVGRFVSLICADDTFAVSGELLPIPEFEQLHACVEALEQRGIVRVDAHAARALRGDRTGYSTRSWQRRVKVATGLSPTRITQFARARAAEAALRRGKTATEVAAELGFADQAHLTRSFVALRAERPSDIRQTR
ncbi:helix-turn-helix domain-containing protein [Agromyces agglutinans]|nr:helix-turn-helix domain-containing protein [Agromyces agglutinans]